MSETTTRYCPATSNLPTRMLKRSWMALCQATQIQQLEAGWKGKVISGTGAMINYCSECRGEYLPPGLEFITSAEMAEMTTSTEGTEMAAAKGRRECEVCRRENASLGNNRGKLACPSCQSLIASVANRIESVAEAARMCGKEGALLTLLGGAAVAVDLESATLKRIAEAMGYDGDDGEVLIKAVKAMTNTTNQEMDDLQAEVERLRGAVGNLFPDDLIRALDCPNDQWELAAIQTAALLDEADRQLDATRRHGLRKNDTMREQWESLAAIKNALGLPEDSEAEQIIATIASLTHAVDRFSSLAEYADKRAEQFDGVFIRCRKVAGITSEVHPDDISSNAALEEWIIALREDNAAMTEQLAKIRAELNVGGLADITTVVRGAVQQARHCRDLADRMAEAEAENMHLAGLLDQQNDTFSIAIDPSREALADFGLAVIRGNVTVSHRG